ncbi:MAG: Asp-tRNA(Asn)/Glu-tRNA(Gln) amidotransferase subunit GatC [Rickettsiales bacterium]|nr:Asp-tRNA(Asn)/Glu-tRNA(Gln) amidotransferase subunit GatC [Rickettsiales bacterium]
MSLTKEDTLKVAKLARIRMDDADAEHFMNEINGILHWVEQLQEVDTEGVEQLTSVSDVALPWRKDEMTDGGYPEQILKNAPASDYSCFVVPKVIE